MLTVNSDVDISTPTGSAAKTSVGVGMQGGATLQIGDKITLINTTGILTADSGMTNTLTARQGISREYNFTLSTDNNLFATVSNGNGPNPDPIQKTDEAIRKSPAEGRAASVSLVTQGADLASAQGMASAREAAKSVAAGANPLGIGGFAAMSGGVSRYNTGSHVDADGFSFMAGLGYVWELSEKASLDLYGKYFWTHTSSGDVEIFNDPVHFDAVNSHRTRFGARFAYQVNENISPYVGAAWEHEFDNNSRSTVAGDSIAAPTTKGSSGLGELGLTWKPSAESGLSVDLGAQGYAGVRQGVSGNLQMKYEF